jgi:hypothetical protein
MIASGARAMDPSPLQDFCVADKDSPGMYSWVHQANDMYHTLCCITTKTKSKLQRLLSGTEGTWNEFD